MRIIFSFWPATVRWWSFWIRSSSCHLIHGRDAAKWAPNTSRMTGDMLNSVSLCKVLLEQLLVCLRPLSVNYVEQSLVLTLAFLFMVEVQWSESYNTIRTERRHVFLEAMLYRAFEGQKFSDSNPVVSGLPGKPGVVIVSYRLIWPDFSYLQWQMPECCPSEL